MKLARFILIVFALYAFKMAVAASESVDALVKNCVECSDTLYLNDGRVIPVNYIKETGMQIKYKKCDDPLNRTWTKEKVKIQKLVFANGEVKMYNETRNNYSQKNTNKEVAVVGTAAALVVVGVASLTGVGIWIFGSLFGVW